MKARLKLIIIIAFLLLLLAISVIAVYRHISANNSAESIILESTKDIKNADTVFYFQSDPQWYNDPLGDSKFEMDDSGCLTTSLTSALCMQKIDVEGVEEITPKTINKYLSDHNVYDSEGNMQWIPLAEAINISVTRKTAGEVNSSKIDRLLKKGIYPIVRVKIKGTVVHYILITESHDGEYWCMDPANKNKDLVPLSDYDNRIYALRYIENKY